METSSDTQPLQLTDQIRKELGEDFEREEWRGDAILDLKRLRAEFAVEQDPREKQRIQQEIREANETIHYCDLIDDEDPKTNNRDHYQSFVKLMQGQSGSNSERASGLHTAMRYVQRTGNDAQKVAELMRLEKEFDHDQNEQRQRERRSTSECIATLSQGKVTNTLNKEQEGWLERHRRNLLIVDEQDKEFLQKWGAQEDIPSA